MASCLLSRHSCCPGRASGRTGSRTGRSPAASAAPEASLMRGSREPIIGAAGEGPRTCWGLCGCRRPMAGHPAGQAAGCIHPFVCPRRAAGGHGAGSRQGRAGPIRWAPAPPGQAGGRMFGGLAPGGGGQNSWRPRARGPWLSCRWRRAGRAADAPVAHAVEDQGEQLAGGGDLGDVLCLLAAAGDDGVLDLARPRPGGLALDGLGDRPAHFLCCVTASRFSFLCSC